MPLLVAIASAILVGTGVDEAAAVESGLSKYEGSWSALLRYESPTLPVTSSEIHPWSVELQAQLTVDEGGRISGTGRVAIQPERYEEGGRWVHVVSPTDFQVDVSGQITLVEEGIKVTLEYRNVTAIARRVTKYYFWQGEWVEDFSYDGLFTRPTYISFVCTETQEGKGLTPSKGLVLEGLYRDFVVEGEVTSVAPPVPEIICKDVIGDAKIVREGKEQDLKIGSALERGDMVKVQEGGLVELCLLDGTTDVRLPGGTRVQVSELLAPPEEGKLKALLGRIWVLVKELSQGEERRFATPSAVTSVRGTEFTLDVDDDGTTSLVVLEGLVEFSDLALTTKVLVGRNQTSSVKPGGVPSEPASIDPAGIDRWWERAEVPDPYLGAALALAVASIALVPGKRGIRPCLWDIQSRSGIFAPLTARGRLDETQGLVSETRFAQWDLGELPRHGIEKETSTA